MTPPIVIKFALLDQLDVPEAFERESQRVSDDILRRSVEASERAGQGGIQQPLAVLEKPDGQYLVVRGTRRLRVARALGIAKVPIAIFKPRKGETPEEYAPELRVILDLRQDLKPSQRAIAIDNLQEQMGMTNLAVSQYLGIDQDTVTNWKAILRYIPEVVEAIDTGRLTPHTAHVFDGLTEKGQRVVWERHQSELCQEGAGRRHKQIRAEYPPDKFRDYYEKPDVVIRRITGAGPAKKRKATPRPKPSDEEIQKRSRDRQRLLSSYSFKDTELAAAKQEIKSADKKIRAATPIIAAIMRNKRLWAMVPDAMQFELQAFAEKYIA